MSSSDRHGTATNGHGSTNRLPDRPGFRLPPQNPDAERGVLGAILLDNAIRAEVLGLLNPDDFYRDDHRILYRAMLDLHEQGKPIDSLILAEELRRRDLYEKIGGDRCLVEVLEGVPHSANVVYHARIVVEKAKARAMVELSAELQRDCYGGLHTADQILSKARRRIEEASARGVTPGVAAADVEEVASLADVRRVVGEGIWPWRGWLVGAHMTVLAAEPGVGKTRLTLDLCRRIWGASPWPDGTPASYPPGTCSLWVASDRHHLQLCQAARDMGLPDEAVRLNAPPDDPCGGLKLDDPLDVEALRRRIRRVSPGLVIIDTVNKATRRLLYRPEEAEAFFGPLLDVARDEKTSLLALTHLSRGGDPLDRRIEGVCRVMWRLERPDPAQVFRRKLWVSKSVDLYPPPLGVTMGTPGNDYDTAPPCPATDRATAREPADGTTHQGGRPASALASAIAWLRDWLSVGPSFCRPTVEAAGEAGHATRTFWRAVAALGVLREGESPNQYFRLPDGSDQPGDIERDADDDPVF